MPYYSCLKKGLSSEKNQANTQIKQITYLLLCKLIVTFFVSVFPSNIQSRIYWIVREVFKIFAYEAFSLPSYKSNPYLWLCETIIFNYQSSILYLNLSRKIVLSFVVQLNSKICNYFLLRYSTLLFILLRWMSLTYSSHYSNELFIKLENIMKFN